MATVVRRNGAYAPLAAHYFLDDAIIEAGEKAEVLYTRGLSFCAASNSDGYITDAQLRRIGSELSALASRARRLVDVGLWQRAEGGYQIRGWLKWNRSAEEIGRMKAADRERKTTRNHLPFQTEPDAESEPETQRNPDRFQPEHPPESNASRAEGRARHSSRHVTSVIPTTSGADPAPRHDPSDDGEPDTAQQLIAEWLDHTPKRPPQSVIGHVGKHLRAMLGEGIDPTDVRNGLALWASKTLHPSALPSAVNEAMNGGHSPPNGRTSTTDERVAQGLALTAQLRAEGR